MSLFMVSQVFRPPGKSPIMVIIPAKLEKRATRRNLLRRRLKAIFRSQRLSLPQAKAIKIYCQKEALGAGFKELKQEALRQALIW